MARVVNLNVRTLGLAVPRNELAAGGTAWLDAIAASGAKAVRFDFYFDQIQPTQGGAYVWSGVDGLVDSARARGLHVLGILTGKRAGVTGELYDNAADRTAFASFAAAAAARFAGRVDYWAIYNEPNHGKMTVGNYSALLIATGPAIRAANSDAFIVGPNLSSEPNATTGLYTNNADWMQGMYAAGANVHYDALAFHPYTYPYWPDEPDSFIGWNQLKNVIRPAMVAAGEGQKKIWITEAGYPSGGGTGTNAQWYTEAYQDEVLGLYLTDYATLPWAGPLFWYSWQDRDSASTGTEDRFGLRRSTSVNKASHTRFATAAAAYPALQSPRARAAAVASASTVTAARGIIRRRAAAPVAASTVTVARGTARQRAAGPVGTSVVTVARGVVRSRPAGPVEASAVASPLWTIQSAASPLAPHYGTGPGKIAIHLDADSTTKDGSGNVTAFQNKGGAGALFDATVVGAAIPLTGKTLDLAGTATGTPTLATSASLIGVRLMWVSTITNTSAVRFFGDTDAANGVDDYEIRTSVSGTDFGWQLYDTESGSGTAIFLSPRVPVPSGLHLFEIEINQDTGLAISYMDGAETGRTSWAAAFTNFYVRRIGKGVGVTSQFSGQMGDILGVTLGAGADAAIADARSYLNTRFGLGLAQATTHARAAASVSASTATAVAAITRRRAASAIATSTVNASAQSQRTVQSTASGAGASGAAASRAIHRGRTGTVQAASVATAGRSITRRRAGAVNGTSTVNASAVGMRTVQSSAAAMAVSAAAAARTIRRARIGTVQAASVLTAGRAIARGRAASVLGASLVAANSGTSTTRQASAAVAASSTATASRRRTVARAVTVVSGSTVQSFRSMSRSRTAGVVASSQVQAIRTGAVGRDAAVVASSTVTALAFVGLLTRRHAYPGEVRGGTIIRRHRHHQGS